MAEQIDTSVGAVILSLTEDNFTRTMELWAIISAAMKAMHQPQLMIAVEINLAVAIANNEATLRAALTPPEIKS